MKTTKIDFYSVNTNGNHLYEFSSNIQLNTVKPLTKIVISKSIQIGVPIMDIKEHNRNSVTYKQPLNGVNKLGAKIFKQPNVIRFYCNKA